VKRQKRRTAWRRTTVQTLVATGTMAIVLYLLRWQGWPLATALASTNFVLFALPHSPPARPRSAVGGHLIALISGVACSYLPHSSTSGLVFTYAVAVGLAFFGMLVTDTEHPPAAGTALSAAMTGLSWELIAATLIGAAMLVLVQYLLKTRLFDLESWGEASASLIPDARPDDESPDAREN
jgi:CBS-domain-containing membrane protein